MVIAEWLVGILIISFSIFCLGIGSVAFVISVNVFTDWMTHNGK
mgnify:FL=1